MVELILFLSSGCNYSRSCFEKGLQRCDATVGGKLPWAIFG